MIEVSAPLPESKSGYKTIHHLTADGRYIGTVEVGYLQPEDLKTFRRLKRKLRVGQPFGVQVFLDVAQSGVTAATLSHDGLTALVAALTATFNGLEARDIYLLEAIGSKRRILGRVPDLQDRQ